MFDRPSLYSWRDDVWSWGQLRARLAAQPRAGSIRLDVLRHGETSRNADGLVTGAADVPLSLRGREQAVEAGAMLARRYDATISSHLQRSVDTLALAMAAGNVRAAVQVVDRRVAERSLGILEGTESLPVPAYDQGDMTWAPPGGDSYLVVTQRILSFLLDLREAVAGLAAPRVLLCSHMGPMRILVSTIEHIRDPVTVITGSFLNARLMTFDVGRIPWPAFVDPELIA